MTALLSVAAAWLPVENALAKTDIGIEEIQSASVTFLENAEVAITVGELYSGQTGAVGIGSASVAMQWQEQFDIERSLPEDDFASSTDLRERTISDLWHTSPFTTKNDQKPKYTASYSINGNLYSERTQIVEVPNTAGNSSIFVTFTPPAVNVTESGDTYQLQAGIAGITFSVSETAASGVYPVSITSRLESKNFTIE
ncbi:hypothetical protein [Chlorobium sp. N1]|uniref:hypothetical protein n=1 Tax=Chlorobium sp. N1 TaxID=2491138 RepID=UPI00103AB565|nr:hypothetical protein [Chlorobium sp. N1]TCD47425.1 hypothetical protein E0L29_07730 [Chlorobium sp. N1]